MARIGLIDVDSHNYPNLSLMKLSAYHKSIGDTVEWYDAVCGGYYDKVYCAKVFSFTPDYDCYINAGEVIRGGTGYCIDVVNGKEVWRQERFVSLPPEMEHIYPDYSLYPALTKDKAYGFLTRGCPRGCDFCIVQYKEGRRSVKIANLDEFWKGQKEIILMDANILACKDWEELLIQCRDSGAKIDFNQGLDIRLMTERKAELIKQIKMPQIHFAWDRYQDKDVVIPKLQMFNEIVGGGARIYYGTAG